VWQTKNRKDKHTFRDCVYKVFVITINRRLFRGRIVKMSHVQMSNHNYISMRLVCKFAGPNHL